MKTREEVIEMLEKEANSWTAIHTVDSDGANANYSAGEIASIVEMLESYDFISCRPVSSSDIDIDIWTQAMDDECRDGLRESIDAGECYIATFESDDLGAAEVIIWE